MTPRPFLRQADQWPDRTAMPAVDAHDDYKPPSAKELVTARLLRIAAALAPEVPQRLQQEYDDWAEGRDPLDFPQPGKADYGVGHWPNIETFMKDKYPAAHRGLFYGMEDAQPLLDFPEANQRWLKGKDPYAGGTEALEQYGYDPSEIAAGMLLLHNQAHGRREDFFDADVERLTDIARKRQRMQRGADEESPWPPTWTRAAALKTAANSDDWHERTTTPAQLRKEYEESIGFGQPTEKWRIPDRLYTQDYIDQKKWETRPPTDGQEQLSQDALPGMEDILGEDTALWRGTPIDTHDPAFRKVWQMTYGQGEPVDDPGMFPDADLRYEDRGGRFDHPDLADAILKGFEEKGGVGTHHSTDPGIADEYARGWGDGSYSDKALALQGPQPLPVLMQTQWNGRGENYDRKNTGMSPEEQEIILRRQKAPLEVRQLMVPGSAQDSGEMMAKSKPQSPWQNVLGDPAHITAAQRTAAYVDRTAMPRQDAYGNNWGDHSRQTEEPTYPTDQVWYHRSDHDLPEGTMLTPSGGKSKWDEVYREDDNRKKWVWMYQPEMDSFYALGTGKNLYQVQPEGEGPYPWNDDDSQYVAPRARIIRKVPEHTAAFKTAAVNQDFVDRLNTEFSDWYTNGGIDQDEAWEDHLSPISSDVPARGPVGDWGNVERFLKTNYPAAHKGLGMGLEEAGHVLDGRSEMPYLKSQGITPYETGPDALATHGYDPAEVASAMLLLHNKSHPFRGDLSQQDQDRLTDIFQKRQQMQRQYEQRTAAVNQELVDGLHGEFSQWWDENQKDQPEMIGSGEISPWMWEPEAEKVMRAAMRIAGADYDDTPYWADAWDEDDDDDDDEPRRRVGMTTTTVRRVAARQTAHEPTREPIMSRNIQSQADQWPHRIAKPALIPGRDISLPPQPDDWLTEGDAEPMGKQQTLMPQPKKQALPKDPKPEPLPEQLGLFPRPAGPYDAGTQSPFSTSGMDGYNWSDSLVQDHMYQSMIDKYNAADPEIREWGTEWYDNANKYIQSLADKTGRTMEQVAGVVSAFSPRTAWDPANLTQATHFLLNYDPKNPDALDDNWPGLAENLKRAKRIADTKGDYASVYKALQGAGEDAPKITSFYKNMLGDEDAVTMDTWMARAIFGHGQDMFDGDTSQQVLGWAGAYDHMSNAVRRAAKDLGISPRALQAIVWTQVNPQADYSEMTPERSQAREVEKKKQWSKRPPGNPQPDYTKGPAYDATDEDGRPYLPPPTYRSAPGFNRGASAEDDFGFFL